MASLRGRGIVRLQTESGKTTLRARQIVLAAGARPTPLPVPGAELACTSDDVFGWDALPASLIIAGGGVVVVEMASTRARFGVRVTVLTRDARVLPEFDATVAEAASQSLARCGVDLILNADVVRIEHDAGNGGGGVAVYASTEGSDAPRVLRAQRVMSAIGRAPNIAGLGLDAAGVTLDAHGRIAVDRHFRTRARGVHAVGDVCGGSPLQLTPVAAAPRPAFATCDTVCFFVLASLSSWSAVRAAAVTPITKSTSSPMSMLRTNLCSALGCVGEPGEPLWSLGL